MEKTLNGKLQQPSARGLSKPEQGYSPVGRARAKIESRQHEKCWEKMSVAAILTFQISTTVTDTNRVEFQGPKIVVSCLEGECGKTSNRLPTCTSFNTCCHLASVTRQTILPTASSLPATPPISWAWMRRIFGGKVSAAARSRRRLLHMQTAGITMFKDPFGLSLLGT